MSRSKYSNTLINLLGSSPVLLTIPIGEKLVTDFVSLHDGNTKGAGRYSEESLFLNYTVRLYIYVYGTIIRYYMAASLRIP